MNSTLISNISNVLTNAWNNYDLVEDIKMDLQIIGAISYGYLVYKLMKNAFLSGSRTPVEQEAAAAAPAPVTEKAAAAAAPPEATTMVYEMDIIFFENILDELVYYALDKLDMTPRELLKVMNKALPTALLQSDINASLERLRNSDLIMAVNHEDGLMRYTLV